MFLKTFALDTDWRSDFNTNFRRIDTLYLQIDSIKVPNLTGTPTTKLLLKLFADELLYKGDFNTNFRKIDSLSIVFNGDDFYMSGDTIRIKNPIDSASVVDAIGSAGYIPGFNAAVYSNITNYNNTYRAYGGLYKNADSSNVQLIVNGNYKTLKNLQIDNLHEITATDSSLTVHTTAMYQVMITGTFADSSVVDASFLAAIFVNDSICKNAFAIIDDVGYGNNTITITSYLSLTANDILKLKFLVTMPYDDILTFNHLNFMVIKF
jgi:hypothetical protein